MIFIETKNKMRRADDIIFMIGILIWIPAAAAGFWFKLRGYEELGTVLTCSVKAHTGIPCPGCGGTRALYSLLCGKPGMSFQYNAAVIYFFCAYIHFMFLYTYRRYIKKEPGGKAISVECYAYAAIAVILGQWFFKLYQYFIGMVVH